ncbi:MAG: hypothetical protein ACQGVK_21250 [Myxococcota bacterium]
MRWSGLGRSLGFAAVAAAATPVLWHATGHGAGVALCWTTMSALYALGIAPGKGADRRTRGLLAAGVVGLAGAASALAGADARVLASATTVALGVARTLWLFPGRGSRALWVEVFLGVGSLALAGFMLRSVGGQGVALAATVWGYWLVQSLFFAAPRSAGGAGQGERDGFEQARRRLLELLDESV